jgi:hypothetical protein
MKVLLSQSLDEGAYRGTSLIRNILPVELCSRFMPEALW